jgi:hypothetical protein
MLLTAALRYHPAITGEPCPARALVIGSGTQISCPAWRTVLLLECCYCQPQDSLCTPRDADSPLYSHSIRSSMLTKTEYAEWLRMRYVRPP